jgi:hypothetical protein
VHLVQARARAASVVSPLTAAWKMEPAVLRVKRYVRDLSAASPARLALLKEFVARNFSKTLCLFRAAAHVAPPTKCARMALCAVPPMIQSALAPVAGAELVTTPEIAARRQTTCVVLVESAVLRSTYVAQMSVAS